MILEASRVREHFPGLFKGLYFHSIITCAGVFLSIVASIMDLIDHISKGRRQENIMHAPRIRPTAPTSVLNPLMAEN
jgi:hypothetical protein